MVWTHCWLYCSLHTDTGCTPACGLHWLRTHCCSPPHPQVVVKSKPIHARARTVLQSYMWSCSHGVSVVSLRCTGWAWMFCCSPGYPWPWDPPTWVLLGMRERPGPANSSFTLGKRKAIHLWTLVFFHNLLTSISRVPGKQNTPALFAVLSA